MILDSGVEGSTEKVKFQLKEDGTVLWYLDGADMFMRDSDFDIGDGNGATTKYDFLHIDGSKGRIGFNILADSELPLTSSIHLMGSIATRIRTLTGTNSYAIKQDDHIMIINQSNNNNTTMTLPEVDSSMGRELKFKRNGDGDGKIIVAPQSGEMLNGDVDGTANLEKGNSSLEVVCSSTGWWVISEQEAKVPATIDANTTAGEEDFIEINFTASSTNTVTLTLPAVADYSNKEYVIKRNADGVIGSSSNHVYIKPASGEFLDNISSSSSYDMANDYEAVTIRSNGSRWLIISNYGH